MFGRVASQPNKSRKENSEMQQWTEPTTDQKKLNIDYEPAQLSKSKTDGRKLLIVIVSKNSNWTKQTAETAIHTQTNTYTYKHDTTRNNTTKRGRKRETK